MATSRLDLLLINPGGRGRVYQALGQSLAAVENPVWAGLLAAFARRRGVSVDILDAGAEDLSPDDVAARVADIRPVLATVVVYGHQPSASTQNMPAAGDVARAIKASSPGTPVLLLGGHVAALPERTLAEEACDFVAIDEGFHTVVDLVAALRAAATDLEKVPGLGYRAGSGVVLNAAAPLVADLDTEVPALTWDLLPMPRYRAHNWHAFGQPSRQPYAAIYTTLGCPYRCTFCCIQAPFKRGEAAGGQKPGVNSYRFWSPEKVIDQIDTLVTRFGVRNLKIADEMFVLHPRHVGRIAELIIERGYDLNIWAYARVDTVRDNMLETLKRAGFNWLAFGIEAADEGVLENVDKRYRVEEVYETMAKVRAAGINVIGNYIFGLPEDTAETMQKTLDLALDLNTEFANFYSTMAYPGSPLYREALSLGWQLPENWSGYSQHSKDTLPLPTRHVTAGEVLRFRDEAFHRYFTHPAYLDMVRRTFGEATAADVLAMTTHRLERRFAAA